MYLTVNSIISSHQIIIEVGGVRQNNIYELDTETGLAKVCKIVNDKLVVEDATFPVDQLHVYLVKPK